MDLRSVRRACQVGLYHAAPSRGTRNLAGWLSSAFLNPLSSAPKIRRPFRDGSPYPRLCHGLPPPGITVCPNPSVHAGAGALSAGAAAWSVAGAGSSPPVSTACRLLAVAAAASALILLQVVLVRVAVLDLLLLLFFLLEARAVADLAPWQQLRDDVVLIMACWGCSCSSFLWCCPPP